jgi:DNA-binding NtrC family response regulator
LEEALNRQQFRHDLYYRLNVIHIDIPPLRERPEDLIPFIDTLLERVCTKVGRPILGISAEALRWMLAWRWPGNVRELANVIERAVILSEHDTIVLEDVRLPLSSGESGADSLDHAAQQGMSLEDVENAYIQKILKVAQGNKAEAARILGIDRSTLYRRLGEEDDKGSPERN